MTDEHYSSQTGPVAAFCPSERVNPPVTLAQKHGSSHPSTMFVAHSATPGPRRRGYRRQEGSECSGIRGDAFAVAGGLVQPEQFIHRNA
jgi:hypothetical protein